MVKPLISAAEWAKRYNIPLKPMFCPDCESELPLTVPFADGKWRGLMPGFHEPCGDVNICTMVTVDEDWNIMAKEFFDALSAQSEEESKP